MYVHLHGQAPEYLLDLLHTYVASRPLRSTDLGLLIVPHVRLKTKGGRALESVALRWWNTPPQDLRAAPSVDIFKRQLKTLLFNQVFVTPL